MNDSPKDHEVIEDPDDAREAKDLEAAREKWKQRGERKDLQELRVFLFERGLAADREGDTEGYEFLRELFHHQDFIGMALTNAVFDAGGTLRLSPEGRRFYSKNVGKIRLRARKPDGSAGPSDMTIEWRTSDDEEARPVDVKAERGER